LRDLPHQSHCEHGFELTFVTFTLSGIIAGMVTVDPILERFRAAISELYGSRIERVVLYGSRARGDAEPESDYDIAVFLRDLSSRWQEVRRITDIELAIRDDTGATVHAMPYPAGSWRDPASPLMYEIRKDGLDL
jgi:predicted nucleotidyltransferase